MTLEHDLCACLHAKRTETGIVEVPDPDCPACDGDGFARYLRLRNAKNVRRVDPAGILTEHLRNPNVKPKIWTPERST